MRKLPVTLVFLTTSKGHFGRRTDWRLTLADIDRQLPLEHFGGLVASLKVTPGDEAIGREMEAELVARGFKVSTAVAAWSRGTSHQVAYNQDLIRISQHPEVHAQPYVWVIEDDGAILIHNGSLEKLLADSVALLASDPNVVSVRLRRRGDDRGPEVPCPWGPRLFASQDLNFQPWLARSRDFQLAALCIERAPALQAAMQIEMLWRHVMDGFTRSACRHAVWECDVAESIHLGVPEPAHSAALLQLNLSTPTPPCTK